MGDKTIKAAVDVVEKVQTHLEDGNTARSIDLGENTIEVLKDLFLLSSKPVLYACNVGESDLNTGNDYVETVKKIAAEHDDETAMFCAKIDSRNCRVG